jgi:hypothetical protein
MFNLINKREGVERKNLTKRKHKKLKKKNKTEPRKA